MLHDFFTRNHAEVMGLRRGQNLGTRRYVILLVEQNPSHINIYAI